MINNNIGIIKNVVLVLLLFLGITACERDIENIGVDLIDNGKFKVGDTLFEIIAYNINIDSSRVDNNNSSPGYLMGVNHNTNFGHLKSSVASQLRLPDIGVNFGDNAIIDLVVLDIPYYATKDTVQYAKDPITGEELVDDEGNKIITPSYSLDSIYGNTDIEFEIKISELETFLNVLDPEDPTKNKAYFSDKEYQISNELYLGDFKPNRNDTVLYVERRHLDGNSSTINDIDTIKTENANPSMKFFLNKEFFKTRFIDNQDSPYFDSSDLFFQYFKGMFIESNGFDGSLINFPALNSKMTIYYTNEETKSEGEDEDLNYNGINGEENVLVNSKHEMSFNFGGIRTGKYIRNYSGSKVDDTFLNPDRMINGEPRLYVQGAAGSESIIKLFTLESLQDLRGKGWLINEANLTLYIDQSSQVGKVPQQLFLYNYDERTILRDLQRTGFEVFGGYLEYDEDGNPKSYKFRITQYISSIIDADDPNEPSTLSLKTFNATDTPDFAVLDSVVKDYSYIPKGVVLHGNSTSDIDKRLKLEIFYSK
ncbi:MAG: DUF4270 domain-containing protein [Bacteroidota bacterium]